MRAYKRMSKNATMALFAAGLMSTGAIASIGIQSFAQSPSETSTTSAHHRWFTDNDNVTLPAGGISEAQASEAITTQYPNLTITHIRLEDENNTVVYSAKLSDGTEVIVDVMNGAVSLESEDQEVAEHREMGRWHKNNHTANNTNVYDRPYGSKDTHE